MPRPRSETTLDDRERARRTRERRAEYVAALEAAVRDAADYRTGQRLWMLDHASTIARARGATTTNATTED